MTFSEVMVTYGGVVFGGLGVALSVALSGVGSAIGIGRIGEVAADIIIKEPKKFAKTLVFQLLPGTHGLYGFVVGLMLAGRLSLTMSLAQGMYLFVASIPAGLVNMYAATAKAESGVEGLGVLGKNEPSQAKALIYTVMVETYALLAFVAYIIFAEAIIF